MKIKISRENLELLEGINITIDPNKNYSDDEIEEILEEIYFNESTNVDYNENLANRFADIADRIESMRE